MTNEELLAPIKEIEDEWGNETLSEPTVKYRLIFNKRGGVLVDVNDGQWIDYYAEDNLNKLIDILWGFIASVDPIAEGLVKNMKWGPQQVWGNSYASYCDYIKNNPNNYIIVEDVLCYDYEPFYKTEWDLVYRVCRFFDRI